MPGLLQRSAGGPVGLALHTAGRRDGREGALRDRGAPVSRAWGPDAGLRAWDTRVVFVQRRGRWWWNAWREQTKTELYGFADSEQDARDAMYAAIAQAPPWPAPPRPREQGRGGAAT